MGEITVELDAEKAPITTENFLKYVDDKFFDGLTFHRVIPGFMIQGGGFDEQLRPKEQGLRAPIRNESGNGLTNARGTIAMARTSDPNSATSQFFINHRRQPRPGPRARLCGFRQGHRRDGRCGQDRQRPDARRRRRQGAPMADVPVEPVIIKSVRRKGKS